MSRTGRYRSKAVTVKPRDGCEIGHQVLAPALVQGGCEFFECFVREFLCLFGSHVLVIQNSWFRVPSPMAEEPKTRSQDHAEGRVGSDAEGRCNGVPRVAVVASVARRKASDERPGAKFIAEQADKQTGTAV